MLGRPSKKPGGTKRIVLFMLGIFMAIDGVESREEGDNMPSSFKFYFWLLLWRIMKLLLVVVILGVVAARKKVYHLWEGFLITNSVVAPLMNSIEAFMARHEILQEGDVQVAHFVLWERFVGEFYTLAEEDPNKRVELFFSKIDKDINRIVVDTSCTQKEAVTECVKKLHELNLSQARPTLALDPPFWAVLFAMIEMLYFKNLKVTWEENVFGLAAATVFGIFCYDNSNALLDKCKEILHLNIRQYIRNGMIDSRLRLQQLLGKGRRLGMRMSRAVGIECFLWVFRVVILVMVWTKKGRAYLEEHICAQIAMSVIIYLLAGNWHVVLDKWKHIKTGMGHGVAAIALGIEQILDEGRAWGIQLFKTVLFGNFCAYVYGLSAVTMIEKFACDVLRGLFENLAVPNSSEYCHGPEIHSDKECSVEQKEDCDTAMTAAESVDVSSVVCSDEVHLNLDNRWSMVVNGTTYIGNARPGGNSLFGMEKDCSGDSPIHHATNKERNRRLLSEYRKSHTNLPKSKKLKQAGKHLNCKKELQIIREENVTAEAMKDSVEGDGSVSGNNMNRKDSTEDERRQQVVRILKKRTKLSQRAGRVRKQNGCGSTEKIRPRVEITFGSWAIESWPVENIIRLYSCSACRYGMFKSNRRYKPGD